MPRPRVVRPTAAAWLDRWPTAGQRFCRWCLARSGHPCRSTDGTVTVRPHAVRRRPS